MANFAVEVRETPGVSHITLSGEIVAGPATRRLEEELQRTLGSVLVVNMNDVEELDPKTIYLLNEFRRKMSNHNPGQPLPVRIVCTDGAIADQFKSCINDALFRFCTSREEALAN